MPQNIDTVEEWQGMLGDDWQSVHQIWLHRLGNLTLTAYNSEMQNKDFETKKSCPGGFIDSPLRLNKYVKVQPKWTALKMEERARELAQRAIEVWPYHNANEGLILQEQLRELRNRAGSSDNLAMSAPVRALLHILQESIRMVGDAIEVVEHRSICYYDNSANFFAELLPMASYIRLLVPLDFDELNDPQEMTRNTKEFHFLPNVTHRNCGVFVDIWEDHQAATAMSIVRQAFTVVGD